MLNVCDIISSEVCRLKKNDTLRKYKRFSFGSFSVNNISDLLIFNFEQTFAFLNILRVPT